MTATNGRAMRETAPGDSGRLRRSLPRDGWLGNHNIALTMDA